MFHFFKLRWINFEILIFSIFQNVLQKLSRPKTRLPKVVKCSSPPLQQDDIEIEIAEVLFGLMKQSQDSNKEDDSNATKLESIDAMAISQNTKSSVSVLPQSSIPAPDLLLGGAGPFSI